MTKFHFEVSFSFFPLEQFACYLYQSLYRKTVETKVAYFAGHFVSFIIQFFVEIKIKGHNVHMY